MSDDVGAGQARRAAVVVPIVGGAAPTVLFIRRADHLRRNAGQVAFPGGLADDADGGDLQTTALREFEEELGASRSLVAIVGRLPDALVVNQTVLVTPYVGVLRAEPTLAVDRNEVAATFYVPLGALAAPGAVHEGVERFDGGSVQTWLFDWNGVHIWGVTARIVRALLDALDDDDVLRRALTVG